MTSFSYRCCDVEHRVVTDVAPWVCPRCLGEVVCRSSEEPSTLTVAEAFSLQQKAWLRKERRFALPEQPLTKERLDVLLAKGASVEGEVDQETGRFYLRKIRHATGVLLLGVQEGTPCIYQNEDDNDEPG